MKIEARGERRAGKARAARPVDPNKSTTALRALRVLEALSSARQPLSAVEVAQVIGTERSTAYRMLSTLMDAGYVARDSMRRYRLGYKLLGLTRNLQSADERGERIQQCLREIAERTGESAHYSVFDRDCAVLVQRAKGTQLVSIDFQIGDRAPLHCTSIGKLLLSFQPEPVIEAAIRRGLPKVARNTITVPDKLRAELRKVRAQRYAFDDLEFADDMRCVAVALFDSDGAVAGGISVSGPASRFTPQRLRELRDVSFDVARRFSLDERRVV